MPLLLIFTLFCSSPLFSLALKPPVPNKQFFNFAYEGPLGGLRYRSSLKDGNPYYEEFSFSEKDGVTSVALVLRGETNTVLIGNDLNLIKATFSKSGYSLSVRLTRDGLVYSTNGVDFARHPVSSARVVLFPEIQLRDFFYSTNTNITFTQLLTGDYRAASMVARKRNLTNLYTQYSSDRGPAGVQECLPIEIITYGLSPAEWAMVYYFDNTGWPVRKQGFFNAGYAAGNNTVFIVPKNDTDLYYLGTPSYTADLITKSKKRQL